MQNIGNSNKIKQFIVQIRPINDQMQTWASKYKQ